MGGGVNEFLLSKPYSTGNPLLAQGGQSGVGVGVDPVSWTHHALCWTAPGAVDKSRLGNRQGAGLQPAALGKSKVGRIADDGMRPANPL